MESTTSLGKYRLLAELGRGGMAKVFLAVATGPARFNKLLVVKQIEAQLADDPEFVEMFLDEARLAARLNHPNIVQTNEVGQEGASYFIAMEYLEGQPLNRVINKIGGQLSLAMQLRVVSEALNGLHHAHELRDFDGTPLGVVHRDISPHNIFVTYSGQVKVVDFGIAKALNSSSETKSGVLKGKIAYMSPEQAMSERVDRRADVFSVGVVLWQLVAGKRMYRGLPEIAVIKKLLDREIPSIREEVPDIDPVLEAIIDKALAPKRDDRYDSAADLQTALDAFVDTLADRRGCRDVGKLMSMEFAEDRRKVEAIVEEQLRAPAKPRMDDLPMIELATMSVSGHTLDQMTPSGRSGASDSMRTVAYGPPVAIPVAEGVRPSTTISSVTMPETQASPVLRIQRKRSYALFALLALICGAALAVGVVAVQKTAPASSSAPAGATASDASSAKQPTTTSSSTGAPEAGTSEATGDPTRAPSAEAGSSAAASAGPIAVKPVRKGPGKAPTAVTGKPPPPPPPSDIRLNR